MKMVFVEDTDYSVWIMNSRQQTIPSCKDVRPKNRLFSQQ
jgi:hypothetical protein